MGQFLLLLVVALTVAAVVFGVTVLVTGGDPGMVPAEPDGRAVPLPGARPLDENDVTGVRFDTAVRGYRMAQVDQALRRAAYDIGYKQELIGVLEAEVAALREGRAEDAETLRRAREAALVPVGAGAAGPGVTDPNGPAVSGVTVSAADVLPEAEMSEASEAEASRVPADASEATEKATTDADRADRAGGDRPAGSPANPGAATGAERG